MFKTRLMMTTMALQAEPRFYPDEAPPVAVIPEAAPTALAEAAPVPPADPPATPPVEAPPAEPAKEEPPKEEPPKEEPPKEEPPKDEPPAAVVPEAYELKAPDDQALDPKALELATPVFKELGLTNDQAQKVVDLYAKDVMPAVAQQVQQQTLDLLGIGDMKDWAINAKADKEIGGAAFAENMTLAAKARDTFASPELRALLETSRMGNHPEVLKLFVKMGKALSEGGFERQDQGGKTNLSAAEAMYSPAYHPKT